MTGGGEGGRDGRVRGREEEGRGGDGLSLCIEKGRGEEGVDYSGNMN